VLNVQPLFWHAHQACRPHQACLALAERSRLVAPHTVKHNRAGPMSRTRSRVLLNISISQGDLASQRLRTSSASTLVRVVPYLSRPHCPYFSPITATCPGNLRTQPRSARQALDLSCPTRK
jgi:hypothetical protein